MAAQNNPIPAENPLFETTNRSDISLMDEDYVEYLKLMNLWIEPQEKSSPMLKPPTEKTKNEPDTIIESEPNSDSYIHITVKSPILDVRSERRVKHWAKKEELNPGKPPLHLTKLFQLKKA